MLLLIVQEYRSGTPEGRVRGILLLIAMLLLGWGIFGPLIHR
jgi:hypothetical protein